MRSTTHRAFGMAGRLAGALLLATVLLAYAAAHSAPVEAADCFALEVTSLTGPPQLNPDGTGTIVVTVENPNPAGTCDDGMEVEISFNGTDKPISSIDGGPDIVCAEMDNGPFAHRERCLAATFTGGATATITFRVRGVKGGDRIAAGVSTVDPSANPKAIKIRPGKLTYRDLLVSVAAGGAPAPAPGGASPSPVPEASRVEVPTLRKDDPSQNVENVKTLQYLLRHHGHDVVIDGYFGPQTEGAVRDFQGKKSLTVDGVVGPRTWGALFVTLKRGDKDKNDEGGAVQAVQSQLKSQRFEIEIDGDFGPRTEGVVKEFQEMIGLDVADGVVNRATWEKLLAAD